MDCRIAQHGEYASNGVAGLQIVLRFRIAFDQTRQQLIAKNEATIFWHKARRSDPYLVAPHREIIVSMRDSEKPAQLRAYLLGPILSGTGPTLLE